LKRNSVAVFLLAVLSLLAGYLLSGISLVGRTGISVMYKEYTFLKSWWKGALIVFIVWMILFIFQSVVLKRVSKSISNIVNIVLLIIAVAGLFFSYSDFHNSLSHRWLGQRFHFGVYLFWLGWMGISVFLLLEKKPKGPFYPANPTNPINLGSDK